MGSGKREEELGLDEEFFFPQNVRTPYRFWLFGPRHLRRMLLAPVLGLVFGWLGYRVSFLTGVGLGVFAAALYTGLCCLPVLAGEETAWDIAREILTHMRSQTRFDVRGEVSLLDVSGPHWPNRS